MRFDLKVFGMALAMASAACAHADGLHIGDDAPQLKFDRWLKGGPITNLEKGQVYVLEFWATWCGPCKQAMPHLSELAKKYAGKATFIGVDVWEDQHAQAGEDLKGKVTQFVREMGDRMSYNVCAEAPGFMIANWMQPAGQAGIPATFVIDKDSKIAWIGHPVYLDEPLGKIIDGTFDTKAFAAKMNPQIDQERQSQTVYKQLMKPVEDAIKAKNYRLALSECEREMATCGQMPKISLAMHKFQILAEHMPKEVYVQATKIKADPDQSWMASEVISMTDGLDKGCYLFALDFFQQKYKNQPDNIAAYAHYAEVYSHLGEHGKAAGYFQQYLDGLKKMKIDPVTLADAEKQLKKFKERAASGN